MGARIIALVCQSLTNFICVTDTELTDSAVIDFLLVGDSRAVANTSIGQITLDPIRVNVSTSLNGLQGLKKYTTIGNVDVLGGNQQALNLSIEGTYITKSASLKSDVNCCCDFVAVFIYNPSNLQLATGDLRK